MMMEAVEIPSGSSGGVNDNDGSTEITLSPVPPPASPRRRSSRIVPRPRRYQQSSSSSSTSPRPSDSAHATIASSKKLEDHTTVIDPSSPRESEIVKESSTFSYFSNSPACVSTRHRASPRHSIKGRRLSRTSPTKKSTLGTPPLVKKQIARPPSSSLLVTPDTSTSSSSTGSSPSSSCVSPPPPPPPPPPPMEEAGAASAAVSEDHGAAAAPAPPPPSSPRRSPRQRRRPHQQQQQQRLQQQPPPPQLPRRSSLLKNNKTSRSSARRVTVVVPPPPPPPPALAGATLLVDILQGRDLVAKDRNLLGLRSSSDPYVQVYIMLNDDGATTTGRHCDCQGQTSHVSKSLSPVWNETITISLGADAARALLSKSEESLELRLFDYDVLSDHDYMGSVMVPILSTTTTTTPTTTTVSTTMSSSSISSPPQWYHVQKQSPHDPDLICHDASGEIQVSVTVQAEAVVDLKVGDVYTLPPLSQQQQQQLFAADQDEPNQNISIGMAWGSPFWQKNAVVGDNAVVVVPPPIEVETYCVAMNDKGEVVLEESLYYQHWTNANQSLIHDRDGTATTMAGKSRELHNSYPFLDNQVMRLQLDRIPAHIVALFIVLVIPPPSPPTDRAAANPYPSGIHDLQRIQVRCLDTATQKALCRYVVMPSPSTSSGDEEDTAMILMRLARDSSSSSSSTWSLSSSSSSAWNVVPLSLSCPMARDLGPLIPTIKTGMIDLVPGIDIRPKGDRIAVMRPERPIRVLDYVNSPKTLPQRLVARAVLHCSAGGDNDYGEPMDIVAILMDQDGRKIDAIHQSYVQSRDQATQWELLPRCCFRDGSSTAASGSGSIVFNLPRVSQRTQSIGFVITPAAASSATATDGQSSSTITNTIWERAVFVLEEEDENNNNDNEEDGTDASSRSSRSVVAHYSVSYSSLDIPRDNKESGLLVACLYRDDADCDEIDVVVVDDDDDEHQQQQQQRLNAWNLRVLSQPVVLVGAQISDYANAWRDWLRSNPAPAQQQTIRLPAVPPILTTPPPSPFLKDLFPVQTSTHPPVIPMDQLSQYLL